MVARTRLAFIVRAHQFSEYSRLPSLGLSCLYLTGGLDNASRTWVLESEYTGTGSQRYRIGRTTSGVLRRLLGVRDSQLRLGTRTFRREQARMH
jgi:hypothetical protein